MNQTQTENPSTGSNREDGTAGRDQGDMSIRMTPAFAFNRLRKSSFLVSGKSVDHRQHGETGILLKQQYDGRWVLVAC